MNYQTYTHERNYGCRLTEFIYRGYRCISFENEKLRVSIAVDKGTDIYEFLYKPLDVDFMWRSYVGLRPMQNFVQTSPPANGSFMDFYEGGWQEMFPNAGNLCRHRGVEIGQHGEVALMPWHYLIVRDDPEEIIVKFFVRTYRTPFYLEKTITLRRNEAILRLAERVVNESGQELDFIWGHHPAFGWPFLDENCVVDLPPCRVLVPKEYAPLTTRLKPDQDVEWPLAEGKDGSLIDLSKIPGPAAKALDMVFLHRLGGGWYALTNRARKVGFGMVWPVEIFKKLWFWQVYRGGRDFPWYSATYNVALEPVSSMPMLSRAVESNSQLKLGAAEACRIEMLAVAYEGVESVKEITRDGEVIT